MNDANREDDSTASIVVVDQGLEGVLIDKGPGWRAACERHKRLLEALDRANLQRPGAEIILRLVADAPVLTGADLEAATSPQASLYAYRGEPQIEWPRGAAGWRDRRSLGRALADLIERNGGVRIQPSDWSAAVAFVRSVGTNYPAQRPWRSIIADAQAWWLDRLPPLLYAHVIDVQRMQPLPRAALARRRK